MGMLCGPPLGEFGKYVPIIAGEGMKRTASLEALMTALILLTVAGIQYSADQQKKFTLFARGADDRKNQSALARDTATYRELDHEEASLGWVAIAAAGFLTSSFVLFLGRFGALFPICGRASLDTADSPVPSKNRPF
jgi:hypothetical protein